MTKAKPDVVEAARKELHTDILMKQQASARFKMNYVPINLADVDTILAALSTPKVQTEGLAGKLADLRREMELRFTGEFADNAVNTIEAALSALQSEPDELLSEARETAFKLAAQIADDDAAEFQGRESGDRNHVRSKTGTRIASKIRRFSRLEGKKG